jgi:hypothetical protein
LNLYDICLEVLEEASSSKKNLDNEMDVQSIATDIYELFYEHNLYHDNVDVSYLGDLKDYWDFKEDLDEDE